MAISFVAAATGTSSASNSTFVLNKPSGLQDGDVMVAIVSLYLGPGGAAVTFTPPTGWTLVESQYGDSSPGGFPHQIGVFTRTGLAADASTYSGSYSRTIAEPEVTLVAAYRGAGSILASDTTAAGTVSSYSTATVNNTNSSAWRIVLAGYTSTSLTWNITSNEVTSRALDGLLDGTPDAVQALIKDSGAAIATGNTNRTISRSNAWDSSCSCILILGPASNPSSGSFAMTLPKATAGAAGEIHDDATIAVTCPSVTSSIAGAGAPVVGDGTIGVTLPSATADAAGTSFTPVTGSMAVGVLPAISVSAETRAFGIRVLTVDEDDRTILVPSRGVDD